PRISYLLSFCPSFRGKFPLKHPPCPPSKGESSNWTFYPLSFLFRTSYFVSFVLLSIIQRHIPAKTSPLPPFKGGILELDILFFILRISYLVFRTFCPFVHK